MNNLPAPEEKVDLEQLAAEIKEANLNFAQGNILIGVIRGIKIGSEISNLQPTG